MNFFAVFETTWGTGLLGWNAQGLLHVALPPQAANIHPDWPGDWQPQSPTGWVKDLIQRLQAYFKGQKMHWDDIPLGFATNSPFYQQVYAQVRQIPYGQRCTYGNIAKQIGSPGAARAVGQAMSRNPIPLIIPCHRVVAAGSHWGGFSAPGGVDTKRRLLAMESKNG